MQFPFGSLSLAAGALLLGALLGSAQGPGANRHKGMRMYDPSTETTFKGTVEDVSAATRGGMMGNGAMKGGAMTDHPDSAGTMDHGDMNHGATGKDATGNGMMSNGGMMGGMMGTHLTVKTGDETRNVMLGPASFIADKGFAFARGDTVEITGSKVTMGGAEYIVARQIVKDGKTLTLRDKTGTPAWASGGRMMGRGGAPRQ